MNVPAMTTCILALYDAASETQRLQGMEWYPKAARVAESIAATHNITVKQAAAIIAHLSPRTAWALNVKRAWEVAGTGTTSGLSRSVAKAAEAREASVPLATFSKTSYKTRSFFSNIVGSSDVYAGDGGTYCVTVDIWAARAAGVPDADLSNFTTYFSIEDAYILAAKARGIRPCQMQAITWVVVRGSAE